MSTSGAQDHCYDALDMNAWSLTPAETGNSKAGSEVRSRRRRWLFVAFAILAILAASPLYIDGDQLFYYPDSEVYAEPASLNFGSKVEQVQFLSDDGTRLHGWWIPAVGPSLGTVVYCHGNHRNLTFHTRYVAWLPRRGFNLFVFDYRGYGKSEGTPDRAGTVADSRAAIDVALARDPKRTVMFGHSLGGAVGLAAAVDRPAVRAVAVESTFSTYRAAAHQYAPWLGSAICLFVSAGQEPIHAAARLAPRPLHVIHGTDDTITPIQLAHDLLGAASEPKSVRIVEGGGHITPWVQEQQTFEEKLCKFFGDALRH